MRLLISTVAAIGILTTGLVAHSPALAAGQNEAPAAKANGKQLYYFMVFSEAKPGAEEEFKRWYDVIHAPVMIETSDFVWSQRMELSPVQMGGVSSQFPKRQHLVIFAIETDDIKKVVADAEYRMRRPRNISSKSMDYRSLLGVTYMAAGPQITQQQAIALLARETAAGRIPPASQDGPPDTPDDLPPPPAK